jgi:uncharacterized protein
MYKRELGPIITKALESYKIVSLLGPRQSGKTTLSKMVGENFDYYNMEDLSFRSRLSDDPKSFFKSLKNDVIIDEVQEWPDILSYIQLFTDDEKWNYRFILTGSNSITLSDKISQSLAGRVRIFQILPLSMRELPIEKRPHTISEALFKGMYPRIYWQSLDPQEWISSYVQTYIQKDVRQLINLDNLSTFDRFLRLVAGRVGQVLNYSSLANDVGTSVPTIKSWISILEASYIVFLLNPHHKNFNKRIIKSPKIYFYDTGIVTFLLRIHSPRFLDEYPLRGNIFENWVVGEKIKKFINQGLPSPYYYWRDQHGHELDLVEDQGVRLYLTEIKSSNTFHADFIESIAWLNDLQDQEDGEVIYGGNEEFIFKSININSWKNI